MHEHESFERESPKLTFMHVNIDFSFEVAAWTHVAKDCVKVALRFT